MGVFAVIFFVVLACFGGCKDVDSQKADTKANQKCYSGFFPGEPGTDVKDIYVYADNMWPDPVYALAFSAPQSIIDEIIAVYQLEEKENFNYEEPFSASLNRFFWWSADERKESRYYHLFNEKEEVAYLLWYNPETEKCQVLIIYM